MFHWRGAKMYRKLDKKASEQRCIQVIQVDRCLFAMSDRYMPLILCLWRHIRRQSGQWPGEEDEGRRPVRQGRGERGGERWGERNSHGDHVIAVESKFSYYFQRKTPGGTSEWPSQVMCIGEWSHWFIKLHFVPSTEREERERERESINSLPVICDRSTIVPCVCASEVAFSLRWLEGKRERTKSVNWVDKSTRPVC